MSRVKNIVLVMMLPVITAFVYWMMQQQDRFLAVAATGLAIALLALAFNLAQRPCNYRIYDEER